MCLSIPCTLSGIAKSTEVEITMVSRIWNSTLLEVGTSMIPGKKTHWFSGVIIRHHLIPIRLFSNEGHMPKEAWKRVKDDQQYLHLFLIQ